MNILRVLWSFPVVAVLHGVVVFLQETVLSGKS